MNDGYTRYGSDEPVTFTRDLEDERVLGRSGGTVVSGHQPAPTNVHQDGGNDGVGTTIRLVHNLISTVRLHCFTGVECHGLQPHLTGVTSNEKGWDNASTPPLPVREDVIIRVGLEDEAFEEDRLIVLQQNYFRLVSSLQPLHWCPNRQSPRRRHHHVRVGLFLP